MTRELRPCGTEAAYRRHMRNEGNACAACRLAHAEYNADHKATR